MNEEKTFQLKFVHYISTVLSHFSANTYNISNIHLNIQLFRNGMQGTLSTVSSTVIVNIFLVGVKMHISTNF